MKKIITWILLLIVLAGGVYWINKLSYKASPLVQDTISIDKVSEIQISTTTKSSITIISPNGGEKFKKNDQILVQWKYDNLPGVNTKNVELIENVDVIVIGQDGKDCMIASIPVIANSYHINVSDKQKCYPLNGGSYKIYLLVRMPDIKNQLEDYSDSYFTIIDSLSITPDRLSEAKKNIYYTEGIEAKGFATSTLNWQIVDGKLPPGIFLQKAYVSCLSGGVGSEISSCGDPDTVMFKAMISGKPTQEGNYSFTIKVSNGTQNVTKTYNINVKNQ